MSFGRNPHVSKAEAAELKAKSARDAAACTLAWREAARSWERAAEREVAGKRRDQYLARAESARASAESPEVQPPIDDAPREEEHVVITTPPELLN